MPHHDDQGRKPYRTYKAGRGRRTSFDDELAEARPARGAAPGLASPPPGRQTPSPDRPAKPYSRYAAGGDGRRDTAPPPNGEAPRERRPGGPAPAPARKRRFRWWTVPVIALLVLVIAAVVATVLAWPGYQKLNRAVTAADKRLDAGARAQLTPDAGLILRKPTTVLLLGLDSGAAGGPARSDTIMLMRFDPGKRTVNTLSIPRDTRVVIPGRGYDKINEAMFWGMLDGPSGPELALKTIKQFLGIPINHVMILNFQGFPRIVDAVGGVDLYVPKTVSTIAGHNHRVVTFTKGWHHFDGKNAMLYVRIRKVDSDFMRDQRQQQFMQALEKKIAQPSNITKIPEIGKRFMSGVTTDLTTNQFLQLAFLKWWAKGGSKQVMVGTPTYIGGIAYVLPPSAAQREKMVSRFLN